MADGPTFYREDRVIAALKDALSYAVKNGGQRAKSFAWDANYKFRELLKGMPESSQ